MVNNAGFTHRNMPLTDVDEHNFDLIVAVNMKGALLFDAARRGRSWEHQGGGVIINTASATGLHPRKVSPGIARPRAGW
ncbi:SDR family NAD(P)-dependent oxidoreductase [Brucella melitensis]|uniref:SDR family NAD(P)-dependent oxidoreductase n=1 Tax=Brucella melitensis TaxID=29459 RepID=UPI000D9CE66D|nr:3-ketoacyl-ACP reductase [Brucella melitensis]